MPVPSSTFITSMILLVAVPLLGRKLTALWCPVCAQNLLTHTHIHINKCPYLLTYKGIQMFGVCKSYILHCYDVLTKLFFFPIKQHFKKKNFSPIRLIHRRSLRLLNYAIKTLWWIIHLSGWLEFKWQMMLMKNVNRVMEKENDYLPELSSWGSEY